MKKIFALLSLCTILAACQSNRATNENDSAMGAKPDTTLADSSKTGKPDTPGKSDGAGTGPSYGSGSKAPDSAKNNPKN